MDWDNKFLESGSLSPLQPLKTIDNSKMKIFNEDNHMKRTMNTSKTTSIDYVNTKNVSECLESEKNSLKTPNLLSTTLNHPKKRGGFQITNVEDMSGDDSEDEDPTGILSSSNDCTDGNSFDHGEFKTVKKQPQLEFKVPLANGHFHNGQQSMLSEQDRTQAKAFFPTITSSHRSPELMASSYNSNSSNNSAAAANPPRFRSRSSVSSTSTPLKTGGSRVYKVVKRESVHPIKREHPDSASLPHPDAISCAACYYSAGTALYSISSSSLSSNCVESLKAGKSSKPLFESSDGSVEGKTKSDDRASEAGSSDHEIVKNMAHYSDGASISEPDDDSCISPNLRIDNKIEAAMDLVKKHLMLAVRDEVDELKERIDELQSENEAMKGILTVDQLNRLQLSLNRSFKSTSRPALQSQSSHLQSSTAPNPAPLPPYHQPPGNSGQHIGSQSLNNTRPNQSHASSVAPLLSPQANTSSMPMSMPVSTGQFQPNQSIYQQLTSRMSPPAVNPPERTGHVGSPFKREFSFNGNGPRQWPLPNKISTSSLTSPTYSHLPNAHPYTYPSPSHANT